MTTGHGRKNFSQITIRTAVLATALGLTACGGGSSSSSGSTSSGGGSSAPTQNVFTTQVVYLDTCQTLKPHPHAEVFLHNAQGGVVDRQTVDAQGRVSFTRTEASLPVTVVTMSKPMGEPNNRVVFEYFDDVAMADIGRIRALVDTEFQGDPQCDCTSGTLTVSAPDNVFNNAGNNNFFRTISKGDNTVTVCKEEGDWPLRFAEFNVTEGIGANAFILNNFDDLATGQAVSADIQSVTQLVPNEFPIYSSNVQIDGFTSPILISSMLSGGEIDLYPEHDYADQALYRSAGFELRFDELNTVLFKRELSRDPMDILSLTNDVSVPDFTNVDLSALGDTGEFDFSATTDFPFLWIDMSLSSTNHFVEYRYSGTTAGRITDTVVYSGYESFFDGLELDRVNLQFFDYDNLTKDARSLSEAIFSIVDNPVTTQNYQNHYRQHYAYVNFEINGSDLDSVATTPVSALATTSSKMATSQSTTKKEQSVEESRQYIEREKGH